MNGIWLVTKLALAAVIIMLVIGGIAEVIKWRKLIKKRDELDKDKGPLFSSPCPPEPFKSMNFNTQERCVMCGRFTPYKRSTPISDRKYYIEGAGQLCKRCYEKTYGNS